jgi:uncharacterized protein (TIGR02099 family)
LKTLLRHTRRAALHLLLAALIALALSLSVLRLWLLPKVAEFRAPIAAQVGALIGEQVRIDSLAARLRGFHPEIRIDGFHILDPQGQPAVRFATVRLDLDTFRTLLAGEPRFNRVEVIGPKFSLRREKDGSIAVAGLSAGGRKPPAWLLADGDVGLLGVEADWQDLQSGAPPTPLGRMNVWLHNTRNQHRLSATLALPAGLGQSLRLGLDARGDVFHPDGWRGKLYLEGHGIDLARWADLLPPARFGVRAGSADVRLWLDWRQGAAQSVAGDFSLRAPVLTHRPDQHTEHRLALHSLASRFSWEDRPDGWRLDLAGFRPDLQNPWPDTRLAVEISQKPDGALSSLSAATSHLELGDIGTVLHSLALPDGDASATLRTLVPRGTLGNARLFYSAAAPMGERLALCGRFRDVGVNAWQAVPGFSGMSGRACGTDAQGHATLTAVPGQLSLPALGIKRAMQLFEFRAEAAWQQSGVDWTLDVPAFALRNADLAAQGRSHLILPKAAGASPRLDLETRLSHVDAAALRHYMPTAVVPDASRWVERALNRGRVTRADVVYKGPTAAFPFRKGEGVFRADVTAEDIRVDYQPGWEPLTQATALAVFQGPSVAIGLSRGRIGAGHIVEAHGVIDDLLVDRTDLHITGQVRAGVADALDFLIHSPLRKTPERLSKFVSASGNADIALKMLIPLGDDKAASQVDGTATFHGATLRVNALEVAAEHLEGPLRFTQDGLSAQGLRASLLGEAALIDLTTGSSEVKLDIRGKAAAAALGKAFPAKLWDQARGAADFRLALGLPKTLDAKSAPIRLALNSDMNGMALDLPAPLGKPAAESRPLAVQASFRADGDVPLQLAYGADLRAGLRLADAGDGLRLASGAVALGVPLPPENPAPGVAVDLRLAELDLGPWRRWMEEHLPEGGGAGSLRSLRGQVGKLSWDGTALGRLALDAAREKNQWRGSLDSDYAKGNLTATVDAIQADLDRLKLPDKLADTAKPATPAPPAAPRDDPDPATVPGLRLRAKHVLWKNADLGPLEVDTERRAHGMVIRAFNIKTRTHQLEIRGHWTRTPTRAASTHLEGKLHIDSLGEFLAATGKGGDVRDTPTDAQFTLDWPGAPHRYAASNLAGEVKITLGKGGLLNVEPGLGRLIGMLNLQSLWRRLSFDFTDMFGKGLAYDGIAGTFRLGGGQAVTEGFLIDAVSARIIIGGRAGLVSQDLDQTVAVIPRTTVALPIAGVLAGGPAVGAAVLVAQQLVGEEIDSIAATHYAVQGSWDNPTITRIHHDHMPLDVLDQAWSGVKNLSGFAGQQEEQNK